MTEVFDRTSQREIALANANAIRLRRGHLRRFVYGEENSKNSMRESMDRLAFVLRFPLDPSLLTLPLGDALNWVRRLSYHDRARIARLLFARESRLIGELTPRQLQILRGYLLL